MMNKRIVFQICTSIFLLSMILNACAHAQDSQPPVADANGPYTGTEGASIYFDSSGSYDPNGTIVSYSWDFGDGLTSTEPNPAHTYTQDDTYTVTLTVTDSDNATDTDATTATVADTNPTANFSASPTSGLEPLTVSFDASGSTGYDAPLSYSWDFGDGAFGEGVSPSHTYAYDGDYLVTMTVTDDDGSIDSTSVTIAVGDKDPIPNFNASPTSGSEPLQVSFTDLSTSYDEITSWAWDFGDGQSSTEQNPTHTYAADGIYTVSLTIVEGDGDTATETKLNHITVSDTDPSANFSASPTSGPEPLTVSFTDTSTSHDGIVSWFWSFGDGQTSTEQNPTHTFTQEGTYTVTLTVSEGDGSTDPTSQTITVTDKAPVADFSASPTSGSEPLQVSFTDLSTSYDEITSWAWDFGDGSTSTEQNPTHVYTADGTYTVSLTVHEQDDSSDEEIKTQYITITDTAPTADFSYLPNPAALTIDFTDQSTSYDGIVSWFWDFGDGQTSTEQNPTHKFPDDGIFSVSLTVTDADGSPDAITQQVSVLTTAPTADFNIVSSPKPAINEDITFLDQSFDPDGFIISWLWDLGDGTTSTSQNVTHRYHTIGTFNVNLTVTDDDGETDTISKSITIYDVVPPVTVDNYDKQWHTSDFTINLTATDDLSGVQITYYQINDGPIMSVQANGQPFISTEGYNTLEYWSVDLAGNEEEHTIVSDVKLDKTNPTAKAGLDRTIDEDTSMTFNGSASDDNIGIISYVWDFGDGNITTMLTPIINHTYTTPGNYTVTLSVADAALHSATVTLTITVLDITKPIANAGDDRVIHEGTPVTFNGSGSTDNVGIASYIWTFVDVTQQTLHGLNTTYVFYTPGVYNVTLTVSDAQGNSATYVVTTTVIDATWPAANAGPDQVVDEDTLVDFNGSASSDNVGIITYIWTFTDGTLQTVFGVNPSYPFETPGVYTVTLNVTDAEGHFTTDTVVITVQDTTPPLIDAGSYATIVENVPVNLDASVSYDNVAIVDYLWDFGDGTSENSTIPSVVHTYTRPGVYMITLTIADEAGNIDSISTSIVVYRDTDGDLIADHIDTDDDNDEMPDDWEIFHGLNPLDPSDASLDPDGDSLSNLTEYQIDSNPNDYTSPSPIPLVGVLIIAIIGFIIFLGILFMRKL